MDECTKPPIGWRCTRGPGHPGPCAAVPDNRMARGCVWGLLASLVIWAVIVVGLLVWLGKPVVKPDTRTACERSTPPWAITERCRR